MADIAITTPRSERSLSAEERFFMASQWQLMWRKFRRHKLAIAGGAVLLMFYVIALSCGFFAPYDVARRFPDHVFAPPQVLRFRDASGRLSLRPTVFGYTQQRNPETFQLEFTPDQSSVFPLRFFNRGDAYRLLGPIGSSVHLFGVEEPGYLFVLGTDKLGRDLFSRILYGSRVSLTIGLVGVALSFMLGCMLGGISGYHGGTVDTVIQRIIEYLLSIPTIPLWMALAAAIPREWSPIQVYFGITVILSLVGWCGLARVVRGKIISLREEDYVLAARISGEKDMRIITGHLLPAFMSYLIVNLTLAIPSMILGETSLSFLGLGIRAPAVSWGTLLNDAQQVQVVLLYPWLLYPGLFVILIVLSFSFLGDGLRDAADPYR